MRKKHIYKLITCVLIFAITLCGCEGSADLSNIISDKSPISANSSEFSLLNLKDNNDPVVIFITENPDLGIDTGIDAAFCVQNGKVKTYNFPGAAITDRDWEKKWEGVHIYGTLSEYKGLSSLEMVSKLDEKYIGIQEALRESVQENIDSNIKREKSGLDPLHDFKEDNRQLRKIGKKLQKCGILTTPKEYDLKYTITYNKTGNGVGIENVWTTCYLCPQWVYDGKDYCFVNGKESEAYFGASDVINNFQVFDEYYGGYYSSGTGYYYITKCNENTIFNIDSLQELEKAGGEIEHRNN